VSFIDKLNRFIALYVFVLKKCGRLKTWLPFFLYGILQFLLLLLLVNYVNSYVYPVLSPIISLFGDIEKQMFHHYPGLYLLLPSVYQWIKIFAGILFEGLAVGLSVVLFLRIYGAERDEKLRLSFAFRRWLHLIAVWTVITAILVVVNMYAPRIFAEQLVAAPRRMLAFDIILRLISVIMYSLFIYAVPAVIVYKNNALRALLTSWRLFFRYPVFSFFLAFIPYLLSIPISYMVGRADAIIDKFTPELVFYLLAIGIALDMIINYVITGTVVKFLLDERK